MHMKTRKRFLALVAAAAMVLAPCVAFAAPGDPVTDSPATGGDSGEGKVEGWVEKDVFAVVLPTESNQLDFLLDPQGLLYATAGKAHGDADFAEGDTLYFEHANGSYSATSEAFTITSKSSIPVDVKLDVTVSSSAVGFTTDSAFTGSTNPEIYLALEVSGGAVTPVEESIAAYTTTLAAVDAENFEIVYADVTGGKAYQYKLKDDTPASEFDSISFSLKGASNANADWGELTKITPTVDLVWTVTPETGLQKISSSDDEIAWTERTEDYSFEIDLSAFGASEIYDLGVNFGGTIFDYNNTWTGGGLLLSNGCATLDGTTVTLHPILSDYLPTGDYFYVRFTSGSELGTDFVMIKVQ